METHIKTTLSERRIRDALETSVLGKPLYIYDTLESTNKTAKELASSGAPDGTVVIADHQTGGRGRLGRQFYSPAGSGIYLSVVLRPTLPSDQSLLITSAAAVAVTRALETVYGVETGIKWVNDVYLGGKKVCGILAEGGVSPDTGRLDYIVVGIGINVTTDDFPEDLRDIAAAVTTGKPDREPLVAAVLKELERLYLALPDASFMEEYRAKSIVLGKDILVIRGDETYPARVIDINGQGNLVVMDESGETKEISTGEVSIRRRDGQSF